LTGARRLSRALQEWNRMVSERERLPAIVTAGLGLATARRIVVDRHDGSLTVDSQPGRTTFHVSLPLTQP
jgi:signal transduction histidine kinase